MTDPFRENLRRLILARRVTQTELAHAAGLSREQVSALVNGRAQPGLQTLRSLARALDIGVGELVGDSATTPTALVVGVPPRVRQFLVQLQETGLWGSTLEETAAECILATVRRQAALATPTTTDPGSAP